jgi:hypothetical protein
MPVRLSALIDLLAAIDGDIRGKARQHAVLQREAHNPLLQPLDAREVLEVFEQA